MNEPLKKGNNVKLLAMPNNPDPIEVGTEGECVGVSELNGKKIYYMEWENGRKLSLLEGEDEWEKINK